MSAKTTAGKRVTVTARLKARDGMSERVQAECLALAVASRQDPGCISYELHRSTDDPDVFLFFERWESREDVDRHLEAPHSILFDERTEGLLDGPEEISFWEAISANGEPTS